MATVMKGCSCQSEYQDNLYGKHMRVFNEGSKDGKSTGKVTCTVCGKVLNLK